MDDLIYRGKVAIVGAPNTGKSTLFNRVIRKRKSIVLEEYGITRDRVYDEVEWMGQSFTLIDTGGVEFKDVPFQKEIRMQVDLAIEEADLIVFLVDGKRGLSTDDEGILKMLWKVKKPIILAVNKIDDFSKLTNTYDFYSFGIKDVVAISATHGIGVGDLLDKIVELLPQPQDPKRYSGCITFSLIGRPNVGKSSLFNAILGEERTIVSPLAGTTRDAIDTSFKYEDTNYVIIDTAGLKKRGKIIEMVDKYASLRSLDAVSRSDVVLLLMDAEQGICEQDKHVVGLAIDQKKPVVIVVNKWDLHSHEQDAQSEFSKELRAHYKFLEYAPIVYVSAIKKKNIKAIFKELNKCYEDYNRRVPTSILNEIIVQAQMRNQPPEFNGGRIKISYISQVKSCPPTFVLFVNNKKFMHFSYERYIENIIRESFDIKNTPIDLVLRTKGKEL